MQFEVHMGFIKPRLTILEMDYRTHHLKIVEVNYDSIPSRRIGNQHGKKSSSTKINTAKRVRSKQANRTWVQVSRGRTAMILFDTSIPLYKIVMCLAATGTANSDKQWWIMFANFDVHPVNLFPQQVVIDQQDDRQNMRICRRDK